MNFTSKLSLALLLCSALLAHAKETNGAHGNIRVVEDQRSTTENNFVVEQKKKMKQQKKNMKAAKQKKNKNKKINKPGRNPTNKPVRPTKKPTNKPTKSPTKSPTKKPTTNNVRMLVTFKRRTGMMTAKNDPNVQILMKDVSWNFMVMDLSPQQVNQYKNDPNIENIEIDHDMKTLGMPITQDDMDGTHRELAESTPWGIPVVLQNVDFFKNLNVKGPKKVCIADTGYNLGHVDLPSGNDVIGKDATGEINEKWSFDGGKHGTHCAGTVAAKGGNNQGVVGIIPNNKQGNFQLVIGKALSESGSGSASSVMKAVQGCVDQGANVVSLSLGCDGCYTKTEDNFYANLYKTRNVLIVAAAGNSGNNAKGYPASYGAVMSVGAITKSLQRSSFSQYNDQVEIVAPGSEVRSTTPDNKYETWDGTSMATPHVAGVAGLLWIYFPECKNYQIRNVLLKTAKDLDSKGCEVRTGYGLIQAKNAYDLLAKGGCGGNLGKQDPVGGCQQLSNQPGPTPTPQNPTRKPTNSPTPPARTPTRKPTRSPTNAPNTDDFWQDDYDYSQDDYDYSQDDYDYSQDDYDYSQDDYWQDDYSQDDYSQDDYSQDDYSQDDYSQDDYLQDDYCNDDNNDDGTDSVAVEIVIKTDQNPEETSWKLYDDSGGKLVSRSGKNYSPSTVHTFKKSFARGCYKFVIDDKIGDGMYGMFGTGYYVIKYDGHCVVKKWGKFAKEAEHEFGDC